MSNKEEGGREAELLIVGLERQCKRGEQCKVMRGVKGCDKSSCMLSSLASGKWMETAIVRCKLEKEDVHEV